MDSAVRRFLRTGEIRFAGFTQAMPVAQVFYGVAWAHAFGGNSASLEISAVVLAMLCGVMFHALAIECGAPRWQALAATGLLICNPCFMFLSFSFMTEIPFLTAMVAAHLAFAKAEGRHEQWWMWLAAAMSVIAFMIRPFGAMAIAGCVGAMILYEHAAARNTSLGSRAVDQDDGAVRRSAGDMRGGVDLADDTGPEAVGPCSSTKITSATFSSCRS